MNRILPVVLGPETSMAFLCAGVFWFCARHSSYNTRDVDILGSFLWGLPFMVLPLAYATIFVPGAKSWWWLGRANIAWSVALTVCANRVVDGCKAPDSGPSVGAYGIFAVLCLGLILGALANAVAGALILAEQRPAFAEWFGVRRAIGSVLTVLASVPIAIVMMGIVSLIMGIHIFFITLFKR